MMTNSRTFPVLPLARQIFEIAADAGFEARIVGGAVRDFLRENGVGTDQPPSDIDMAVAAPIEIAAKAFRAAGLRVIETGLSHGTVTVLDPRASDGDDPASAKKPISIEVTQTRVDVTTDGRHATVAFRDDWLGDAQRRDFTINAIYIRADGSVDDPLGGRADLAAGHLRFVGDAAQRVCEDALRMLRYCRFLPLFGRTGSVPDAIAAIAENADLARALSGERVAGELARIYAGPDAASAIALMRETGLDMAAIGVGLDDSALEHLPPITAYGDDASAGWLVGLGVAMPPGYASSIAKRLRLSGKHARYLEKSDRYGDADMAKRLAPQNDDWQKAAWHLVRDKAQPAFVYAVATARTGNPVMAAHCLKLAIWQPPKCPVTGTDLLSQGVDKGPALGQMLERIEARWVQSSFSLSKQELMADAR